MGEKDPWIYLSNIERERWIEQVREGEESKPHMFSQSHDQRVFICVVVEYPLDAILAFSSSADDHQNYTITPYIYIYYIYIYYISMHISVCVYLVNL